VVQLSSFLDRLRRKPVSDGSVLPLFHSHEHCITLSALIREHWGNFKDMTRGITFERSATIYAIGDSASTIYSIVTGRVKLVRVSPAGKEQTVGLYAKDDLFGEVCLCGGTRREEQAVALEATDAIRFNMNELLELMKSRPMLLIEFSMVLCSRLHESQERVAQLVFDDTRQRLAKQLLSLNRSFNVDGETEQPITLTHEELAHLVNTTRERVTLVLNEFRRMGLVEYSTASIRVFPDRTENYLRRNAAGS
jgi:CRP/FNR family transcriptional regulator, cyclic AMP receptor protein